MSDKPIKFKLHFNRVNMQRKKKTVWTVRTSKACYQVEQVKCYVSLVTTFNPDGAQPRAFLSGYAYVYVHGKTAYLVDDTCIEYMNDDDYFEDLKLTKPTDSH